MIQELWHPYDINRFEITLEPDQIAENEEIVPIEASKSLGVWYEQIKIATEKVSIMYFEGLSF